MLVKLKRGANLKNLKAILLVNVKGMRMLVKLKRYAKLS